MERAGRTCFSVSPRSQGPYFMNTTAPWVQFIVYKALSLLSLHLDEGQFDSIVERCHARANKYKS